MRNAGGYVRVYRSIADWEWYHDDRCVRLFLHLLIKSNWSEGTWKGKPIVPGQIITSSVKLGEQLGWNRSAVVRTLDKLKSTGELDIQTNNHWSLVTLANWDKYQGEGAEVDSKPRNKRTTTGQPLRQPPNTIEEGKEEKKERREEESAARAVPVDPKAQFIAACKAVVDANPDRLPVSLRKGFLDYWTETDAKGKMRFQDQDFFDHGRRMDTWRKRAEKSGDIPATTTPVILNANGKPQQLKPWVN